LSVHRPKYEQIEEVPISIKKPVVKGKDVERYKQGVHQRNGTQSTRPEETTQKSWNRKGAVLSPLRNAGLVQAGQSITKLDNDILSRKMSRHSNSPLQERLDFGLSPVNHDYLPNNSFHQGYINQNEGPSSSPVSANRQNSIQYSHLGAIVRTADQESTSFYSSKSQAVSVDGSR